MGAISDALISLGALAFIGWIVFAGMAKKNPLMISKLKEFLVEKKEKITKNPMEKMEQVYDEKRSMM